MRESFTFSMAEKPSVGLPHRWMCHDQTETCPSPRPRQATATVSPGPSMLGPCGPAKLERKCAGARVRARGVLCMVVRARLLQAALVNVRPPNWPHWRVWPGSICTSVCLCNISCRSNHSSLLTCICLCCSVIVAYCPLSSSPSRDADHLAHLCSARLAFTIILISSPFNLLHLIIQDCSQLYSSLYPLFSHSAPLVKVN